jgi:hypothetical protein
LVYQKLSGSGQFLTINFERALFVLAGSMVIITVLLAKYHNPLWLWFTLFIGLNMFQSAFTGFCPAKFIMQKLGLKTEAEIAADK